MLSFILARCCLLHPVACREHASFSESLVSPALCQRLVNVRNVGPALKQRLAFYVMQCYRRSFTYHYNMVRSIFLSRAHRHIYNVA